jgi:hypothetical protein
MNEQIHVLNGDSLKDQFPKSLHGEIIIARECLVDGDVSGTNLDELFKNRAEFLSEHYSSSKEEYFATVVPEFQRITELNEYCDINLWFEDDLFCQVNFWFVCSLLHHKGAKNSIFLIRPEQHNRFGFAGLTTEELLTVFEQRLLIEEIASFSRLWDAYRHDDFEQLKAISTQLPRHFEFVRNAVSAHLKRIPTTNNPGRPTSSLLQIMEEFNTTDFGIVFREFNKRENIYGFGDLQVKRLFDQIIRDQQDMANI